MRLPSRLARLRRVSLRLVMGLALVASASSPALAVTRTWTGAGANNLWATPQNWQGNVLPASGDALVFPAGAPQATNANNFPSGTLFHSLRFFDTYTVTGNRVLLDNHIHVGAAAADVVTLQCNVTTGGGASTALYIEVVQGTLVLSGVISGTQGFTKSGLQGTMIVTGTLANTFTGEARAHAGTLVLDKTAGVAAIPAGLGVGDNVGGPNADVVRLDSSNQIVGPIRILGSGYLNINNQSETADALTMSSGRIATGVGVLTLGGDVEVNGVGAVIAGRLWLGGQSRTFTTGTNMPPAPSLDIQAVISNGGAAAGVIKKGTGILALTDANTYSGVTSVDAGTLQVLDTQALGLAAGGTVVLGTGLISLGVNIAAEPLTLQKANSAQPALQCEGLGARAWNGPITLDGSSGVFAGPSCSLRLGAISGTGELWSSGTVVELNAAGSYVGDTRVQSGVLRLNGAGRIPDTSVVRLNGPGTILDLNGFSETIGGLTGLNTSQVTLGAGTLTVLTQTASGFEYGGGIAGGGGVLHDGPGLWQLSGVNAYTGPTTIAQGVVHVSGSLASAGQVIVTNGTLTGAGTVGSVNATGGRVAPGFNGTATMTAGSITLTSQAVMEIGFTAGAHSRIAATGAVSLGGAALELHEFAPIASAIPIVLIDNDGVDPIAGTFGGLAEGALIESGNYGFHISYVGGSGNDVILTPAELTYFLAEGSTGDFFDTEIALANPHPTTVPVTVDFLIEGGGTVITQNLPLAPMSRTGILVEAIPGLESTAVSTKVRSISGQPIVVERTMWWGNTRYGAHTEKASAGIAPTWYFAEGSQGFFFTFLLLANPVAQDNVATVRFLLEGGGVVQRTYTLAPLARQTVYAGDVPELIDQSFGMEVTFSQGGVAERAMYFGEQPFWKAGHESAGVTAPSTTWFLAEGATGPFFETFVLLANPNATAADATVRFLPASGVPVIKQVSVPANGRSTINIEAEDVSLGNVPVATDVLSSLPIVVERAQYWPDPAAQWYEAHNSFGVTETGVKWGLAEGRVGEGPAHQTYILLANPGASPANVTITFLREFGAPVVVKQFTVNPTSRLNVAVGPGTDVPELADERFGALIESSAPVVVERAMYANAGDQLWGAGTNATATKLP